MTCPHMNFSADCKVARLTDSGRFILEVKVHCTDCDRPFQFVGLQPGFNFNGATCSIDGLEGNFPICPQGSQPNPLQQMMHGGHNS